MLSDDKINGCYVKRKKKEIPKQPHVNEVDEYVRITDNKFSHISLHINLTNVTFRNLKKRGCLGKRYYITSISFINKTFKSI